MQNTGKVFVLDQGGDYPLSSIDEGAFSVRYAYARSREVKENDQPGQDFLAFHIKEDSIRFVICDGVGQSFYGDYSARYLGMRLLDWIDWGTPAFGEADMLRKELHSFLNTLCEEATQEVAKIPLPDDMPVLLRDVLEEKRVLGSATTFVGGRIDLPGDNFAFGRAVLLWAGNTRLRVGAGKSWGELIDDGLVESKDAWSSVKGLSHAPPGLKIITTGGDSEKHSRFIAYSDGLASMDGIESSPDNETIEKYLSKALQSAASDDCSFIEIELS